MNYFERFINENSLLISRMKSCDHGRIDYSNDVFGQYVINPFHVEGDVWSHTMMVMNEIKSYRFNSVTTDIAAMLHDIGKCDVREVVAKDDGSLRVRFFNHAGFSFYRAIDVMKDWDLPAEAKMNILSIISLHGEFYDFVRGAVSVKQAKKLGERFKGNSDLWMDVAAQVTADCNGRHSFPESGRVNGDALNYFITAEMLAELPVYENPHGEFYERRNMPVVTMLVGPPACGKSTWVSNNHPYDKNILSRDNIVMELGNGVGYTEAFNTVDQRKVDQIHGTRLMELINNNKTFIVDQTNMSRKSRRKILSHIGNRYWKKAVVFATGYNEIMRRRGERKDKNIPDYVMHNMIGSFMVPLYDEFDEIEWVF